MEDVPTQVVDEVMFEDEPTQVVEDEVIIEDEPEETAAAAVPQMQFNKPHEDNILKIKIGHYYFSLIETTNSIIGYETIRIISYISELTEKYDFWCYRSHSELGMWRVGTVNPENIKEFFKGPDKVQHTLIHLELQKFINENMHHMDIVENIPFTKENLIEHNLITFSDEPMFVDISRYPKYNELLNSTDRQTSKIEPFNTINKQITCGQKNFNNIADVLRQFSDNFEKLYTITNTEIIIPNYTYTFEGIFAATGNIYETILVSNDNSKSPDVILYYLISEFTINQNINEGNNHLYPNINKICNKSYHIMPILLTINNNINLLGVYEQYIPAGIYICKALDRSASCKSDENQYYRVTSKYTYISNRYDDLFPYLELYGPVVGKGIKNRNKITTHRKNKYNRQTIKQKKTKTNKNKNTKKKGTKKKKRTNKNKSNKYGIRTL